MRDYQGDFRYFEERLKRAGREDKLTELYNLVGLTFQEINYMVELWCSEGKQ